MNEADVKRNNKALKFLYPVRSFQLYLKNGLIKKKNDKKNKKTSFMFEQQNKFKLKRQSKHGVGRNAMTAKY